MTRRRTKLALLAVLAVAPVAPLAHAENFPLLEQLNQQTQSLYREVQGGIVRVQLPVPLWRQRAADQANPLKKWDDAIDPQVKQALDQKQRQAMQGRNAGSVEAVITGPATTRPATQPSTSAWKVTKKPGSEEVVLEPRAGAAGNEAIVVHAGEPPENPGNIVGPLRPRAIAQGNFSPNNIGLLLDDAGHVMVPLYIEKEAFGGRPVRLMVADAETTATYVGSDEKTQVTILKMTKPVGRPVRMGASRPPEGALVMMLNPNSGSGRLALWTGGERDYGVVVSMDGSVAGIVRLGQFLGGHACKPVIDQLIKTGSISRATLGATLTEIRSDHPLRQQLLELADRPALVIDGIKPDSLAAKSGLKDGDLLLELDNTPVGDLTTWAALTARPTEQPLLILRAGKQLRLNLDLR